LSFSGLSPLLWFLFLWYVIRFSLSSSPSLAFIGPNYKIPSLSSWGWLSCMRMATASVWYNFGEITTPTVLPLLDYWSRVLCFRAESWRRRKRKQIERFEGFEQRQNQMYASFISVLHVKVSCAKAKSHPTHIYIC
jgi:hypothetical protein